MLRRGWDALRQAADLPWITPHCLRHQLITELFEKDVPVETISQIVGHVSSQMTRHYSHGRLAQHADALNKIAPPLSAFPRPKPLVRNPELTESGARPAARLRRLALLQRAGRRRAMLSRERRKVVSV
jgi:hypothetical protein